MRRGGVPVDREKDDTFFRTKTAVKTVDEAEVGIVVELFDGPAVGMVGSTVNGALAGEIPDETACDAACIDEAS